MTAIACVLHRPDLQQLVAASRIARHALSAKNARKMPLRKALYAVIDEEFTG
jgi:hypothetical protein